MKKLLHSLIALLLVPLTACAQDFSKPDLQSSKSEFMTEIHSLFNQCAKQDFTTGTNIPTGTIRYNRTNDNFQEYNGSTWSTAPLNATNAFSAGSINTNALADGSVTSAKIADGTIAAGDIGSGAVTAAKLGETWQSWTPTIAGTGGLGVTVNTTHVSQYINQGRLTCFTWYGNITTSSGSASSSITVTPPVTAGNVGALFIGYHSNTSRSPLLGFLATTTSIQVYSPQDVAYAIGGPHNFALSGCYRNNL